MRSLVLIFFLFAALGCSLPGLPHGREKAAEILFDRGLDELAAGGRSEAFAELQRQFPASRWANRAEQLARLAAVAKQQKSSTRELTECRREQASCQEETNRLRKDLGKLKQLVIEMELRGKGSPGKKH